MIDARETRTSSGKAKIWDCKSLSLERKGSNGAVGIEDWLAKSAKPKPGEVCDGL